ncbi:MAG: nucleotidyltransferase domain-containing protein [Candidatus Micrarchaeota archaeon]
MATLRSRRTRPAISEPEAREAVLARPEITARRMFTFPLSPGRRRALAMLKTGKPNPRHVLGALGSGDWPQVLAGIYVLDRFPQTVRDVEIPTALLWHENKNVRDAVNNAKYWCFFGNHPKLPVRSQGSSELMSTQRAHFATRHPGALAENLAKIEEITGQLRDELGDRFIGVGVYGSVAKGYFEPKSDLDFRVFGTPEARERFIQLAKEKGVCPSKGLDYAVKFTVFDLFNGLYFGDRDRLLELQRRALGRMTPRGWSLMVQQARIIESSIGNPPESGKAQKRLGFEPGEEKRLFVASVLARVPPTLAETKAILKRQANARIRSRRRFARQADNA